MDAAARTIVFVNLAHIFTHYGLLILATAVLAMVVQEPGLFGTVYGPILALGTGMFVVYGLGSLPMGWLAARIGRPRLMAGFFFGTGAAMVAAGFATGSIQVPSALSPETVQRTRAGRRTAGGQPVEPGRANRPARTLAAKDGNPCDASAARCRWPNRLPPPWRQPAWRAGWRCPSPAGGSCAGNSLRCPDFGVA